MSEANYINHPIRATLDQLDAILSSDQFSDPAISADEGLSFARDKIIATCKMLATNIRETPAILVSVHGLNQIQNQLQTIRSELATFQSDHNPTHITSAANTIDQSVAQQMWTFLPNLRSTSDASISPVVVELRDSALRTISQLTADEKTLKGEIEAQRQEISRLNKLLDDLSEKVTVQKAEAMSVVSQVRAEYAEKESQRISEFSAALDGFKTSFSTLEDQTKSDREAVISDLKQRFREFESQDIQQRDLVKAQSKAERDAILADQKLKLDEFEKQTKEQSNALIKSLEKSNEETARIVAVVGNNAVTGKFQVTANSESKQANIWRNVTIGLFVFAMVVAIATFIKFLIEPFTSESAWAAAIRLLYAIAMTAPAFYTARESARHRTNADRARQTELELTSLGPFIELMTDEKKMAIREGLIGKYFGRDIESHVVAEPFAAKDVKDVLIEAFKAFKK